MKVIPIALILLLGFAFASTAGAEDFSFGVKGGLTWADRYGDVPDEMETRYSYMAGAFGELPLTPIFSVQSEFLYVGKGYKRVLPGVFPRNEIDFKLNYIDVPVLLKVNWVFGASEPYIIVGPSLNFLMSAKSVTDASTEDIKDEFSSTEFGFVAGFGLNMRRVLLEGRYCHPLTDANSSDGIKNRVLALMLGYTF